MGVYIKGMKMPKSCSVCREIYYVPDSVKGTSVRCGIDNKLIHQYSKTVYDIESGFPYKTNRPDWCPLGDVPTPHGRLTDADALTDNWYYASAALRPDDVKKVVCLDDIDNAPTIIEAEG